MTTTTDGLHTYQCGYPDCRYTWTPHWEFTGDEDQPVVEQHFPQYCPKCERRSLVDLGTEYVVHPSLRVLDDGPVPFGRRQFERVQARLMRKRR